MENRPHSLAACLSFIAFLLTSAVSAQEALPKESAQTEIERGLSMQARARHIRQEALAELALERDACEKKFFVNDCSNDAYDRYLEKLDHSRKMDEEGRRVEIEQRKINLEATRAQRSGEAAARLEKDGERAKAVAEEREAREASYEERQIRRVAETEKKAQKAAVRRENARKKEKRNTEARQVEEKAAKARNRNAQIEFSESEETQR